jgi:hypothetical protein
VHDDPKANESARALGAEAFTLGRDVAFKKARYDPNNPTGQKLLTHELAHVVQQTRRKSPQVPRSSSEKQAEAVSEEPQSQIKAGELGSVEPGIQRRVEIRDVGRGEQSGMARVGELIDRLNRISTALIFSLGPGGVLAYTENPYGDETEFDRRMKAFIDAGEVLPLRMTNRHGLMTEQVDVPGPFKTPVDVDSYRTGYVDIDDLLAADDLGIQAELLHVLRERQATKDYSRRIGTNISEREEKQSHHQGLLSELALLRDFFEDPGIRAIDLDARIFRSTRNDTIRPAIRHLGGAQSGAVRVAWEVIIRRTGQRLAPEEYRDLLRRERAAGGAGGGAP